METQNFDYSVLFDDVLQDLNPWGLCLDAPRMRSAAITLNLMARERRNAITAKQMGYYSTYRQCISIWWELRKDMRIINRKHLYQQNKGMFL